MRYRSALVAIKDNYSTYWDENREVKESHATRLLAQVAFSIGIGCFTAELSDDAISVLITSLSILIGFAFSALFPISADPDSGMPYPTYSEDWENISTIWKLSGNFRHNVRYFIPLSLSTISLLALQMLDVKFPAYLINLLQPSQIKSIANSPIIDLISLSISVITFFLLEEIVYTFYRMCSNALSLLRIKENYKLERFKAARRDRS